jgi:site-specific recombinase XerD
VKFLSFLDEIGTTVETFSVQHVLSFMQMYVEAKRSASGMRSVHAALAHYLQLFRREKVMHLPIVVKFVKGAENLAPPTVKKDTVWDAEIPLRCLVEKEIPDDAPSASREALLLLLLATGMRVSDVFSLSHRVKEEDGILKIPFRRKTKTGWCAPKLVKRFSSCERICPVRAVLLYLDLTREFRVANEEALFVSKLGKAASMDTLRIWVRKTLQECGISASAGSCRSAATSSAFDRSVPIDEILDSANWASKNTFFTFYKREVKRAKIVPRTLYANFVP